MIDLHMHSTASDGRCSPEEVVRHAHDKGIHTVSLTDHDTMAGVPAAAEAAARLGMTFIPWIEITSVHGGRDVHVLAYFLPELSDELTRLLAEQRRNRLARAHAIADRLAEVGAPIDVAALMEAAAGLGKSLARPQIAQALIAAGHVSSVAEAFDRFLAEDGPAYIPHHGASPADVVELIGVAGGVASMAHPGYTKQDEIIPELVAAGLGAIEAYHSSHDPATTRRYVGMAHHYGVAVSGGSDFHGEGTRRCEFFGVTSLPAAEFGGLVARRERAGAATSLR